MEMRRAVGRDEVLPLKLRQLARYIPKTYLVSRCSNVLKSRHALDRFAEGPRVPVRPNGRRPPPDPPRRVLEVWQEDFIDTRPSLFRAVAV